MSESNEWELPLTIRRKPSHRKLGPITYEQFERLWDNLVHKAHELGFTIAGVPRPKRTNCPHCGRIIRRPAGMGGRCPMCGVDVETGKVR